LKSPDERREPIKSQLVTKSFLKRLLNLFIPSSNFSMRCLNSLGGSTLTSLTLVGLEKKTMRRHFHEKISELRKIFFFKEDLQLDTRIFRHDHFSDVLEFFKHLARPLKIYPTAAQAGVLVRDRPSFSCCHLPVRVLGTAHYQG